MSNGTVGPGGHTQAQKEAIAKARHDAAMAEHPEATAAKDLARNYPTPHNINDYSTDELKYIILMCGIGPTSGVTPALYASGTPTMAQRINNAWCQGGAGVEPDTQPGTNAGAFYVAGLYQAGVTHPPEAVGWTPTPKALAFVDEFKAYEKTVSDAKDAAVAADPNAHGKHRKG